LVIFSLKVNCVNIINVVIMSHVTKLCYTTCNTYIKPDGVSKICIFPPFIIKTKKKTMASY